MHVKWFKGCTNKEQKEARKKEIKSYKNAFEELKVLLELEYEEAAPDYDIPSWSHKQADVNGANRKLNQILKYLNTEE